MKQFGTILQFELKSYLKNKIFVGVTLFLVLVIGIVMFFPRISAALTEEDEGGEQEQSTMLVSAASPEATETVRQAFSTAFPGFAVQGIPGDAEAARQRVVKGEADCAFLIEETLTGYTYCVDNLSLYDQNTMVADEVLREIYRLQTMQSLGLSPEQAAAVLNASITHEIENLGVDQIQNFFYTYIMVFALYMVILLYGQMVATNVASEKSSRAMEVLITSAKPTAMMFGKVIASCLAGLLQLIAVFGSAFLFFNVNKSYWDGNEIIQSIFNMPLNLLLYMLLFFMLGFFLYAFLYGAVGSTASKLEDINTSVMPITMLFIAAFIVVMYSLGSGDVNNPVLLISSYIPFTSPMAMFTRIAMSVVPWYEIAVSVAILLASVVGVGVLSAKIYRVGVLLYGTPPKLGSILKSIRKA